MLFVFSARLIAGDVEGKFEQLFTRVGSILKKSGQFDVQWPSHFLTTLSYIFHHRCCYVWVRSSVLEMIVRHSGRN